MAIIRPIEEAHASNWARRCQRNGTVPRGTVWEATKHQSGSCRRITGAPVAIERVLLPTHPDVLRRLPRRSPADSGVPPCAPPGSRSASPAPCNGSPAQAAPPSQPRRLRRAAFRSARVPFGATLKKETIRLVCLASWGGSEEGEGAGIVREGKREGFLPDEPVPRRDSLQGAGSKQQHRAIGGQQSGRFG